MKDGAVPCGRIEAETEEEAKRLLLLSTSRYGIALPDGLYEFISSSDIGAADLRTMVELPDLNLEAFIFGYVEDKPLPNLTEDHYKGLPEHERMPTMAKYFRKIPVMFMTKEDLEQFCLATHQLITPTTQYAWYPVAPERVDRLAQEWVEESPATGTDGGG